MITEDISRLVKRNTKRNPTKCRICGAPAMYSYYGVISCLSCKMFFKRNGEFGRKPLKCDFIGQCEITHTTRHACASCRLSKCFLNGMKTEMIRGPISGRNRNCKSYPLIKMKPIQQLPTLSLLHGDKSLLNNKQWTLLTNLIHNYDESDLLLMIKCIQNENKSSKVVTIYNELLIQELITSLHRTAALYLQSTDDIIHLSSDDRSILLRTAADNLTCLTGVFILSFSEVIYEEFFFNHLQTLYGNIIMNSLRWSAKFTQSDLVIFKLALALFTFSPNLRTIYRNYSTTYTNIKHILDIQNKYAELLWKYLIYKYGYDEAVQRFLKVTEWFLALTVFISYAHNDRFHVNSIDEIIEQTELTLILDDIDGLY